MPPKWTLQIYWDLLKLTVLHQQKAEASLGFSFTLAQEQYEERRRVLGMPSYMLKQLGEGGGD